MAHIVSDEGYGKNDYIETERELIVVTAPGPGSGKMATCLSQLYHDHRRGIKAGYAKFETFPIWNLPLKHPVNIAYEAATADLNDVNMIDPFHLEAYGVTTVNYNRDVEIFPVLNNIFERIYGESPYKSPTDMCVNMAGNCIFDDEAVCKAANNEIIRRYLQTLCDNLQDKVGEEAVFKTKLLMKQSGLDLSDRPVVGAAQKKEEETGAPAAALQLDDGTVITGKTLSLLGASSALLLGASSALLLNALKVLAGIRDDVLLLSPAVIEPIQVLKTKHLGNGNPRLHIDEILIALSICAVTSPTAMLAMQQLPKLRGLEMHSTVILSQVDVNVLKKLGVHLATDARYQSKKLYHRS